MKKGQNVKVTVKGAEVVGKIVEVRSTLMGQWIDVNITPEAKPKDRVVKSFRPKGVTPV